MAISTNTVQNNSSNNPATTSAPARSQTYRVGTNNLTISEGQTLKGVVSDIHGEDITLSLDDGTSFTGKLPDANQYSIGQKAAFQITSIDSNKIYMKAMTSAYLLDIEDTIEQALEEASLPKTPRNIDVVRSLLENSKSISRENILASIRMCAKYPDANVNAVITMDRLKMPMTDESVKQFSNYQNNDHQVLYKMDSLTDSLNNMMKSIGEQVPRFSKSMGEQILTLALDSEITPEEVALKEANLAAANEAAKEIASETLLDDEGNVITPENANVETESADDEAIQTTLAGEEAPVAEEIADDDQAATGPFAKMKQIISNITDSSAITAAKNALLGSGMVDDYRSSFINEQTGYVLSPQEREEFLETIKDLPISDELKEQLEDGTVSTRDFLTEIKNVFSELTEDQASKLISSKGFGSLIKSQLFTNWTLSPETLKNEGSLESVYEKINDQVHTLQNIAEKVLGKDVYPQVSSSASDINDNIDFMKTLNETFQYIQLPMKLQNQNAHGDLFVMTRKDSLKKDPKNLKALLHLELDNLGALDIHIQRENTAVSCKFLVEKQSTADLLGTNIEMLSDAINKQGYAFTSELSLKEKDVDIVNDFIGQDAPSVGELKRYNFDLRA